MKQNNSMKIPELLAPAGSVESFYAAFEAGADAVYIGIRDWNARAYADNFTVEECADLLAWATLKKRRVYLAINSLIISHELGSLYDLLTRISTLSHFKSFGGLIVQDMGVVLLARRFFPEIPLHLSTLSGIHNLQGVEQASRWGIKRVVLARELPFNEVVRIAEEAPIEVEVFIHGALCFSFSGFCMASSFRGGRSGLRGQCAQPCRLCFYQGRRQGFFLSCSDFSGLSFVPALKKSRVAALKIEGRMKSPDYVANAVKAYRMVLDAKPENEKEKIAQAEELLLKAPSRRLSHGFWSDNLSKDVLSPHRSGTNGIWIATIESKIEGKVLVRLRNSLHPGDIIRPEAFRGKEERLRTVKKVRPENAKKGDLVELEDFSDLPVGTRLFLVGRRTEKPQMIWKRIRTEIRKPILVSPPSTVNLPFQTFWEELTDKRRAIRRGGTQLIVKVGTTEALPAAFHSPARWVMLTATLQNLEALARMRIIEAQRRRLILSIPAPVVGWTEKMKVYEKAVGWFLSRGFSLWEINNISHLEILRKVSGSEHKIGILGGARLNVRNPAALAFWANEGCFAVTLSPDMTKEEFNEFVKYPMPAIPMVVVYSWMPLMVSLLEPGLMEDKPFSTEKGDRYYYLRRGGLNFIYSDRPISLLGKLGQLKGMGYYYFVVDLSEGPKNLSRELSRILSGFEHERDDEPFTDCNWNLNLSQIGRKSHD